MSPSKSHPYSELSDTHRCCTSLQRSSLSYLFAFYTYTQNICPVAFDDIQSDEIRSLLLHFCKSRGLHRWYHNETQCNKSIFSCACDFLSFCRVCLKKRSHIYDHLCAYSKAKHFLCFSKTGWSHTPNIVFNRQSTPCN